MHIARIAILVFATASTIADAQATTNAGPTPRPLPAPSITSPRFAGSAFNIVALPNGTLLVNDVRNHRVMLSDSLLRVTTVVIDSTEYGTRPASLLAYPGDSVMFVEAVTPSMTLIDPSGKVVRSMAVPNARDISWLMPTPFNMGGVDARGRFVHRGLAPRVEPPPIKPGETRFRTFPDSTSVVRDNPVTHAADTIAWIKSQVISQVQVARADGRSMGYSKTRPPEIIDEWAVLANGTLAVVRGRDYHIDLFGADGKVTALPRIPYPWVRFTDEAKVAWSDSLNKDREESMKTPPRMMGSASPGTNSAGGGGLGGAPPNRADYPPPPPGSLDVKPTDFPDYHPAFSLGAVRADADGNLWIRTEQKVGADTMKVVRDIVNSAGKLIDRVVMSKDRSIIGFDRRGNVFLLGREDGGIQWIERVRWRN